MAGLKPPGPLILSGNVSQNYKDWIKSYEIYAIASGVIEKDELIQCNIFLHVAGPAAQKIHSNMEFSDDDKDKIKPLKDKFQEFCEGKRNVTLIRHKFNNTNQKEGETFDEYLTELQTQIKDCEYGDLADSLLCSRIIDGVHDDTLGDKLLQIPNITLKQCIETCRLSEINAPHRHKSQVNQIRKKGGRNSQYSHKRQSQFVQGGAQRYPQQNPHYKPSNCSNCGRSHKRNECPAYKKQCHGCGKWNHFHSVCRSNPKDKRQSHHVHHVEQHDNSDEDDPPIDSLFIGEITVDSVHMSPWTETMNINNQKITFKLDTGSEADILPYECFNLMSNTTLHKSHIKLVSYSGHNIVPKGQTVLSIK